MVSTILVIGIIVFIGILSSLLFSLQFSVSSIEDNFGVKLEKYEDIANSCDLKENKGKVDSIILSANQQYYVHGNTTKAQQILQEADEYVGDCDSKQKISYYGISEENLIPSVLGAGGFTIAVLTFFGIKRKRNQNKDKND